jgi:TetR/AcrR family transcriptional repressor of nem operon
MPTISASGTATTGPPLVCFQAWAEAARGSAELCERRTEAVRSRIDHLIVEADGFTPQKKWRVGIAAWSAMVGAMVLARLVDDERLSKEILKQTRASLPLK